jgi:hypothetical protein
MELFIQIRDGQPFEHPIFGDNFRAAFPHINVNNLPPEFARFERIACPEEATGFQIDEVTYQWVDGIVKDVWSVRPMNDSERATKIQELTERAYVIRDNSLRYAQTAIDQAPTETIKQLWINYLSEWDAWVLVDPTQPKFPKVPVILEDGTVYTTNNSGSAPNVIE